jgi:hypothetical protein
MNKRFLTILIVALTGMLFLSVAALTAAEKQTAPDEIMLENKGYKKDKKGPVKLTHKKHNVDYKIACVDCHHVYKDGKNVWEEGQPVQKCSECHNVYMLGKDLREASDEEKKLSLYKAYHDNCKGCHKKEQKGPVKCAECHAKIPTEK